MNEMIMIAGARTPIPGTSVMKPSVAAML